MVINLNQPHLWKADIRQSIAAYNNWFLEFAPETYRNRRIATTVYIETAFQETDYLRRISPTEFQHHPAILETLRMCTAPPIARDRLVGLAGITRGLVDGMEKRNRLPRSVERSDIALDQICETILKLLDKDLFSWLDEHREPNEAEIRQSAAIVADRLCGAQADPIVRNAQEQRQLSLIQSWLIARGYSQVHPANFRGLPAGTFAFRLNVPIAQEGGRSVNLPVDAVIMKINAIEGDLPIFIEAKSAGDFANTNKRRKEEAVKVTQLRYTYGQQIQFLLFLCGYFDTGYLGYEAAEGIDWIWEHRIEDLARLGV